MKFAFMKAEKASFTLGFMCQQFGVSRSGYYAWCRRGPSQRKRSDAQLRTRIGRIYEESRQRYGSPRVHAQLVREGLRTSRKRVARLMREGELVGRRKRRFRRTTDSNHAFPVAPNLVARAFDVAAPNQLWVADITYIPTGEGFLYLAAILDAYSRQVVGWALRPTMATTLCLEALEKAVKSRRPPPGLVHHSDRGVQYASAEYRRLLEDREITCSMSRVGDCWDNAVAESFWSTLKAELFPDGPLPTHAATRLAVFEYIEGFYNQHRLHSHLGYRSPAEFESIDRAAAHAA